MLQSLLKTQLHTNKFHLQPACRPLLSEPLCTKLLMCVPCIYLHWRNTTVPTFKISFLSYLSGTAAGDVNAHVESLTFLTLSYCCKLTNKTCDFHKVVSVVTVLRRGGHNYKRLNFPQPQDIACQILSCDFHNVSKFPQDITFLACQILLNSDVVSELFKHK